MRDCIVFQSDELLPDTWRHFSAAGPVRTFNPALLRHGDGWIFAYRVVGPDGCRRIGLCRLDSALRIIADSRIALSDLVRFPDGRDYASPVKTWFADPRLYRLAGRPFIYWNSGWHEPRNYQFLQELAAETFRPIGPPREMILRGKRQVLEKNWTLFGTGPFYAAYSVSPHALLQFTPDGPGDIAFEEIGNQPWDNGVYAAKYGLLRGGAPPQPVDGHYWSICHSVNGTDGNYRYVAAVFRFAANPPFAPSGAPAGILALGNPFGQRRLHPKLNPAVGEVLYPCGAAHHDGSWLVSYGINDEHCAISILPHAEIATAVQPLGERT